MSHNSSHPYVCQGRKGNRLDEISANTALFPWVDRTSYKVQTYSLNPEIVKVTLIRDSVCPQVDYKKLSLGTKLILKGAQNLKCI